MKPKKEDKLIIDFESRAIKGYCRAKDFRKQIEEFRFCFLP